MDLKTTIKIARGFGLVYFLSFWLSLVFGIANGFFGVLPKFDKLALFLVVFVISSPALFLSMFCYAIAHHLDISKRILNKLSGAEEEINDDDGDNEQARQLDSIRRKVRANQKHPSFS